MSLEGREVKRCLNTIANEIDEIEKILVLVTKV